MPKVQTPNLDLPIRFDGTDLAVNEMDSADDAVTKARVLMAYRPGDRDSLPEFGTASLVGKRAPLDLAGVTQDLQSWIPEHNFRVTESGTFDDPSDRRVQVEVDEPSIDQ